NSVVKRRIADGSVEFLHVRVGHRQAPIPRPLVSIAGRGFCFCAGKNGKGDEGCAHVPRMLGIAESCIPGRFLQKF
ncbi:hypothetical protein, partial [Pseudomonas sp. PDM22]|uniref:hypothetical protein n=1 Tax=Pseudomonas sp. PDM22 TaxID=2769287 RepID=UPI001CE13C1A